jgi:NADPH:quinone reductase-like Zn-dependent oxidoreductase
MKRILIRRPGSYERLEIVESPDPVPGPGELLIRAEAIGVNYADCVARMGLYASARELVGYPLCPGFEVAGRVAAVGDGVSGWSVGTPVMGVTLFGGYSTHVVLPASQTYPLPPGLIVEQAAAFPAAHLTAWFGLMELAHPRHGETVLVHSAAGGVGSVLVQLARNAGCGVIAVVGAPHKREIPESLGAQHVIDKSSEDLWSGVKSIAPKGCEIVLDANGASTLADSYSHLAPTGRLVVYGFHSMLPREGGRPRWLQLARTWLRTPRFDPLAMTRENRSVLAFNLSFLGDRAELLDRGMNWLIAELAAGRLEPPRTTTHSLEDVADAHRALESGRTTGKLVLTVGNR